MSRKLVLATRNAGKVTELRAMLEADWEVRSLADLEKERGQERLLPEIEETGSTFLENATLKAEGISREVDGWVLADDSGLEVDALDGKPGVHSARYAGRSGHGADAANNAKLLRELKRVGAEEAAARSARFRCVIVLAQHGKRVAEFDGACEGTILSEAAGAGGFGYDPLFQPQGHAKTFGELGPEIKNTISHRAKALASFVAWAQTFG